MAESLIDEYDAELFYKSMGKKGKAPLDSQIHAPTHYLDSISHTAGEPAGNSRIVGDASYVTQIATMDVIISKADIAGLSLHDKAYLLAIANHESGFNPDAAAGQTTASGLGQFIDYPTGLHYGLDLTNRWNTDAQAQALVNEYIDAKSWAAHNGYGEEYIYAYHHDGPTLAYGGLAISNANVMPRISDYEAFLVSPMFLNGLAPTVTVNTGIIEEHAVINPDMMNVSSGYQAAHNYTSPLVLDLDGDRIELSQLNNTGSVYWDGDVDGFREASGWVKPDDGLLVRDVNADGVIDNNSELFGNNGTYANGFLNLKSLDSNSDNLITSADAQWSSIKVWKDTNQDGISQSTELYTLSSLGITQINLAYSASTTQIAGNDIKETSTFVMGGVTKAIDDVWFATDQVNSVYDGTGRTNSGVLTGALTKRAVNDNCDDGMQAAA